MANYHLTQKVGKRSTGQSAKAKADYITREGKYTKQKDRLVFAESGNMPAWAQGSHSAYWEMADLYERANGKLFYELEFSLPLELTEEERVGLAQAFAQHIAEKPSDVAGALPYTIGVHAGNEENPHAHLMVSERANDGIERNPKQWFKRADPSTPERGGAKKTRALQPKKWLEDVREKWAEIQNEWLSAHGHDVRVDHRTLLAQGIDRPPQIHVGPTVAAIEKKGIKSERGELNRGRLQAAARHQELQQDLILCQAVILDEDIHQAAIEQLGELNHSEYRKMNDALEKIAEGTIEEATDNEEEKKVNKESWKLKLLREHYGDVVMEDPTIAKYWNPERLEDGQVKLSNKAGSVLDKGDQIYVYSTGLAKGDDPNLPAAAAALHLATRVKGWKEINVNGSDDFKRTLYGLAYQADIKVNIENEQDRKLYDQVKADIDKRNEENEIQNSISEKTQNQQNQDGQPKPRGPRLS